MGQWILDGPLTGEHYRPIETLGFFVFMGQTLEESLLFYVTDEHNKIWPHQTWPNLKKGGSNFKKKDIKHSTWGFHDNLKKSGKEVSHFN